MSVCEGEGRDEGEVLLPCETHNTIVLRTFCKDDCYFCLKYLFGIAESGVYQTEVRSIFFGRKKILLEKPCLCLGLPPS